MDDAHDRPQLAALMGELAWLRRLARALLRGADGADDLVQDTWLAAAQAMPAQAPSLRPWLARVAVNLHRSGRRSHARRLAREEAATEVIDPVRSPEELVRRLEIHQRLANEVAKLDEPYRSTILLHYFEELTSAAIARRLVVPEGTVRRRLKVALDQLRERLGARDPRKASMLAPLLAPLAEPTRASAGTPRAILFGVLAMKKVFVSLAILVLVIAAAIWWHASAPTMSSDRQVAAAGASGPRTQSSPDRDPSGRHVPAWFATRGASRRAIAGRVTFDGKPVAGAVVVLHDALTRAGIRATQVRRTGDDGRFDFGSQLPAPYDVAASAAGKAAAIAHIELADPTRKPPAERLELRLGGCLTSASGTVFDASGGTIPRARVRRDGLVGVEADDQGAYELCLPYGSSRVRYSAEGYGAVDLTVDARGGIRQDVVLVPEAVLVGWVVDDAGERPVAGVYVSAYPKQPGVDTAAPGVAVSGDDGRFRIGGVLPGWYRVRGFGDGVVTDIVEAGAKVGDGNSEITLHVNQLARISGKVVSEGAPVAGATVMGAVNGPPWWSEASISQTDGSFAITRAPVGDMVFSAAPYRVISPAHFEVRRGVDHDRVVIEVERVATIRGRVTRRGVPVAGARVCCVGVVSQQSEQFFSDTDGHYEIVGVIPGTHRIGADHEELGAMMDSIPVTVAAGEVRTQDLEMDLAATISGVVVDQDDRALKGVLVKWTNEKTGDLCRAVTDAQGRYRCSAMTGGASYRAAVFPASSQLAPYETADGNPYPVVELPDGKAVVEGIRLAVETNELAIAGKVVDTTGEPVVDAEVKAMASAAGQQAVFNSWMKLPRTVTDSEGAFRVTGLTRGTYALWARSPDGAEGTVAGVAAGDRTAAIRIDRPGNIEGRLVDFPTQPVVYATMLGPGHVIVEANEVTATSFRFKALRAGKYVLNAETGADAGAQEIEVKSGARQTVVLRAQGRGTIEGTVSTSGRERRSPVQRVTPPPLQTESMP